jgi:hypothetical protein
LRWAPADPNSETGHADVQKNKNMSIHSTSPLASIAMIPAQNGQDRQKIELVMIPANLSDCRTLVNGVRGDVIPILLDPSRDGVTQVAERLARFDHGVDVVHIVDHGQDGVIHLAASTLNDRTWPEHAAMLACWSDGLAPGARLMFWNCEAAAGAAGRSLLNRIAAVTGASVVAASTKVGADSLGGRWALDFQCGGAPSGEAGHGEAPFIESVLAGYGHVLATDDRPLVQAGVDDAIVFIEDNVPDFDLLVQDVPEGTEVVILDHTVDGLAAIADTLAARSNIGTVHIITHGADGQVDLGAVTLTADTLDAHAGALATIKTSLNANADILLYGCDIAAGQGAIFLQMLQQDTGASIAASTGITGSAALGGNWVLEAHTGSDLDIADKALTFDAYPDALVTYTWSQYSSGVSGTTAAKLKSATQVSTLSFTTNDATPATAGPVDLLLNLSATANPSFNYTADGYLRASLGKNGSSFVLGTLKVSLHSGSTFTLNNIKIEETNVTLTGYNSIGNVVAMTTLVNPNGASSLIYIDQPLTGFTDISYYTMVYQGNADNVLDFRMTVNESTCFLRGTRIRTDCGDVPIENLKIGDLVFTYFQTYEPVRWIARKQIFAADLRDDEARQRNLPVRVSRHAIMDGMPSDDLYLSPCHALFMNDILIPVGNLVNGITITQLDHIHVMDYYHIELENHNVIYAEGVPAETYIDAGNRLSFDNVASYYRIYPFRSTHRLRLFAPGPDGGEREENAYGYLAARARRLLAEDEMFHSKGVDQFVAGPSSPPGSSASASLTSGQ